MYCPACGREALESTNFCQYCGQVLHPGGEVQPAVRLAGFWLRFVAFFIDEISNLFFIMSIASHVFQTNSIQKTFFCLARAAQRCALPAGGWDEITPFCRNQLQATQTA